LVLKDIPCGGYAHEDARKTTQMKHQYDIAHHENSGINQGEVEILDIGLLVIA